MVNKRQKILGTGLSGLVGSRIVELLSSRYEFENLSRSSGFELTDREKVLKAISSSHAPIVLHAAAYTDVKKAEADKSLGEQSDAWRVNVLGTQHIAEACKSAGKKLIYISTDLVLGGDIAPAHGFSEDVQPNPLSWYAKTKYEGELRVQRIHTPWVIMRIAYPYRSSFIRPDFVRFFINGLREGKQYNGLTDRIITPTFIDDIAYGLDALISQDAMGIYHVVGNQKLSIYESLISIAKTFDLSAEHIGETTREAFLVGRAPEPFHSELNNAKITKLGVKMRGFEEGLEEVKRQMSQS